VLSQENGIGVEGVGSDGRRTKDSSAENLRHLRIAVWIFPGGRPSQRTRFAALAPAALASEVVAWLGIDKTTVSRAVASLRARGLARGRSSVKTTTWPLTCLRKTPVMVTG
jgi:hypothetical protein